MNLNIIGEKILVKQGDETKTAGGLLVPAGLVSPENQGLVVAIGNVLPGNTGCKDLQIGDEIVWFPFAGTQVEYQGQKYLVIRPNDVIGVIKTSMVLN